jgi:hypothetical protein
MVEHNVVSGAGLRGSGEISIGLADAGAVAYVGATYLPEGRWVKPSYLAPVRTGGNPRIRQGSSVVVVVRVGRTPEDDAKNKIVPRQ